MDILFAGLKGIKEMKVFILQTILHLMSELILTLDRYKVTKYFRLFKDWFLIVWNFAWEKVLNMVITDLI